MNRIMTLCASLLLSGIMGVSVFAQSGYEVKGVVNDPLGPVIGATVVEQGTTNGVSTGLDGDYVIYVAGPEAIVEISCIGYATQTFKASEVPQNIVLSEDTEFLDEVVVIGYGSQKKKEVTGSVASVKSEDFNAGVKTSPVGLLQGKVAGLNIIKTTSDPTSTGFSVQIRGFSTLDKGAGTSPLYIVDGVPVSNIDNISPDEIASMDVLKDGSAAAIYGTRGTNGVIIITTKRGDNFSDVATTRVEYSGYSSASVRNGDMGMATAEEFRNLATLSNGAVTPVIYTSKDGQTYDTDWVGAMTRGVAMTHNHNVAIVGSSSKFNYRASFNYKDAQGIAKHNNREEMIAKIAASQKALDGWLELQYDLSYMHYRNDYNCGNFKQAAIMNPTYPIYDSANANGFFMPTGTGTSNPVEQMEQKESYGDGNFFRGSIKATLNIKPVKGLKVSGFGAIEEGDNRSYWYNGVINTDETGSGMAGRGTSFSYSKLFETTADYVRSFGQHNLSAVAGFSYQKFLYDGMNVENKGFPTEDAKYYQIGNGDASKKYLNASSYRNSNALAAAFGRVNYNYAEKYLVSASLRREGSSRFGANNKWGWFPAVSLGWRLNKESWFEDAANLSDLKLRAGFGVTGNQDFSSYKSLLLMDPFSYYYYDGKWVTSYAPASNPNPNLAWERKNEFNVGLDFGFFGNRLGGTLDYYYRLTTNLLYNYTVPVPPYDYGTMFTNVGSISNQGLELTVYGTPVQKKDFEWNTTLTLAKNSNKLIKFTNDEFTSGEYKVGYMSTPIGAYSQRLIEGHSLGTFYAPIWTGVNKKGEDTLEGANMLTGKVKEEDWQNVGSAYPALTFGWSNSFRIGQFGLSATFRGQLGGKIFNTYRALYENTSNLGQSNILASWLDDTSFKGKEIKYSTKYIEDASFLKLDNISASYDFKFKNEYINKLRLYLTAQNIFCLTGYTGVDPEVSLSGIAPGIEGTSYYPRTRTFTFGATLTF